MLTRTRPYTQQVKVSNKSVEEVYEAINIWLRYNSCNVIRENPPYNIEAHYSAEVGPFLVGPNDTMPKDINVRVSAFGREALVYFTVTQSIRGKKTAGYIYWGTKLQKLYEELGVEVTDSVWRELFPPEIVRDTINRRRNMLIGYFLVSLAALVWLWNPVNDSVMMYFLVIMLPVMLILFWDMQAFRRFLIPP